MKKLFLIICFSLLCLNVNAKVTALSGFEALPSVQQPRNEAPKVTQMDWDEFEEMVAEGFSRAKKVDVSSINQTTSVVRSTEENSKKEEDSIFKKIYDQAVSRITISDNVKRDDVAPSAPSFQNDFIQQQVWQNTNVPTIVVELPPNNQKTAVPAMEHIPYLMSFIEVLPSGLVKFEETIVVIANGQKLQHGLTKILPLRIYTDQGKAQRLDYSIINVSVNDVPVDYHFVSNNKNVFMVPDENYMLDSGVYTYKFEYVVDNLLWRKNNNYIFYWDIGGNGWNLVVDRLGASLNLPQQNALKSQQVLVGSIYGLDTNVSIKPNGPTAYAYIASRPLFIGEGMHLMAEIDANALLKPDLWQKIIRCFYNSGDIILAGLAFVFVVLSFIISWKYIVKDKGQLKLSLSKTAMTIRYLLLNRIDQKSICGFLLELYRKNIIDIQQAGETILLIKRTDNLQSLSKIQQKALKYLFPAHETVFNVSEQNKLPFKRFSKKLKQGLIREMTKFRLKLNVGYLLLGAGIVMVAEMFIATLSFNTAYNFSIMFGCSVVCLGAIGLWCCGTKWWQKLILRSFSVIILALGLVILSAIVHPIAAMLLIVALMVIVVALGIYAKRFGLIKHYIHDITEFKNYIQQHKDTIVLGKNFLNYQAAIWAFDLENEVKPAEPAEYNKIDIVRNICTIFS